MNKIEMKNFTARQIDKYVNLINTSSDYNNLNYTFERARGILEITRQLDIINSAELDKLSGKIVTAYSVKVLELTK